MSDQKAVSTLDEKPRGDGNRAGGLSDRALWWIATYVPFLGRLVARRERTLAKAECASLLEIVNGLRAGEPSLEGESLYARVIMQRLSCDAAKAREVLRRVDESFAQWPEQRDIRFRDVANYLIVVGIMDAHSSAMGTRSDMEALVAAAIPKDL